MSPNEMALEQENRANPRKPPEKPSWLSSVFLSPLLWGGLMTVGFYQLIPYLPAQRELAERYFCGHPLEYTTAALFFVGIAILGLKAIRVFSEKSALDVELLNDPDLTETPDLLTRASLLEQKLSWISSGLVGTSFICRIRDVCAYVRRRQSANGLEEHLKYLAELSAERLQASYALVRTITWAVPIIGFLGTVIGITIAIANVTPDQLDTSLGEVTSGLAVAFDTTALALALSIVLVFSSFLVERSEQRILADVEDLGTKQLALLFPTSSEPKQPLAEAELRASQHLIEKTQSLVQWQAQLWQEGLESLRSRWTETLEEQQASFEESIQQGLQSTLDGHQTQLGEVRVEFLTTFQSVSQQLKESHSAALLEQREMQETFQRQLAELWQQVRADFSALREDQTARIDELMKSSSQNVSGWQAQLKQSTDVSAAQLDELRRQGEILLKVVEEEQNLARLEKRLTDNLQAVRAAETFEETLHSLSAAVHLLTARTKPKAA